MSTQITPVRIKHLCGHVQNHICVRYCATGLTDTAGKEREDEIGRLGRVLCLSCAEVKEGQKLRALPHSCGHDDFMDGRFTGTRINGEPCAFCFKRDNSAAGPLTQRVLNRIHGVIDRSIERAKSEPPGQWFPNPAYKIGGQVYSGLNARDIAVAKKISGMMAGEFNLGVEE